MPSLKELRTRIRSVKSTEKITSAMKMIAVAKLRRAQERVEMIRPFALGLGQMVQRIMKHGLLEQGATVAESPKKLLILVTSDRGLCGAFNSNLVKEAYNTLQIWNKEEVPYTIYLLGQRGKSLFRYSGEQAISEFSINAKTSWEDANEIAQGILKENFTYVEAVYARFKSVLVQQVTRQCLIPYESLPFKVEPPVEEPLYNDILEPKAPELLKKIVLKNLTAQLYRILLESSASEHSARLTAMDNATRNARDVIDKLQVRYNRTRQMLITKELIEVISGAEAL